MTIWGHSTAAGLPPLGPSSTLSQQSDSIMAHMEGERSEGWGWLKQVHVRWLGPGPAVCGAGPWSGEKAHACAHNTRSVGFPLTRAEVFSMCHSGNLEQVNPAIPALHLEHHRQPCLSSGFIFFFLATSKAASFLPELKKKKKKESFKNGFSKHRSQAI